MRTWFALLGFKSGRIKLVVSFATPSKVMIMNGKVRSIVLNAFGSLNATYSYHMTPFPAILALWDSQVHICPTYCGDKTSHIELSIDDFLSIGIILCVPNVDLYNGYI